MTCRGYLPKKFYSHLNQYTRRNYGTATQPSKIKLKHLLAMKKRQEPISMITAYDYNQGKLADKAGVDMILVGDSCANVMLGLRNTNEISLDAMVHHCAAASRGVERAYLVGDMPFASYLTTDEAIRNACKMVSNGHANCVKLEGFMPEMISSISRFVPVCGHLGLLPQTADCFGVRGNNLKDIARMKDEALKLQDAGCSFLVLEKVCVETAKYLSAILEIPTIGIGSGPFCDGQVLVWHDMLGLGLESNSYKFVKKYANLSTNVVRAIENYVSEVKNKSFPTKDHSYYLSQTTKEALEKQLINSTIDTNPQKAIDWSTFFLVHDKNEQAANRRQTKVVKSAKELRKYRNEIEGKDNPMIVFIPFLGGLHEGHLTLVKHAKKQYPTAQIWTSLFLNPTQFNDPKDLDTYPMNMQDDIRYLTELGVDVIFTPSAQEMYPLKKEQFRPYVDFYTLSDKIDEAKQRPGHFQGVGSVVTKLFAWVRPHKAIFGQKDFIQCVLITRLSQEFFPDLEIIVHPTVRESTGLAMSSRNNKLTLEEKQKAPLIYQTLSIIASHIYENSMGNIPKEGGLTVKELRAIGTEFAQKHGVQLEYIAFHEVESGLQLNDNDKIDGKTRRVCISIAGSVGKSTRLIDNIQVGNGIWNQFQHMKIY